MPDIFTHYDLEEEVISIGTPIKTRNTNKTIGVLVNLQLRQHQGCAPGNKEPPVAGNNIPG